MKKQIMLGLLLSGLLVLQSGTSSAVDASTATAKATITAAKATATGAAADAKAAGKSDLANFANNLKKTFTDFFNKTTYETKVISISVPLPAAVTKFVDGAPDLIKNALIKLNNDKPLTSLVFDYDLGYGGAGADQTGDLALSKGFAHVDAKGAAAKIVELLFKIPGIPDEVKKPINNMLGLKGSTVCLIKLIFLAKKDFTDPKTGKTDSTKRWEFISKEVPLLMTRLAFTPDFHGPADWIETFLKPLGLEPLITSIKIDIDATTYYEWKKQQKSKEVSAFYKDLSAALDTNDLMTRQKNLNDLLTTWNSGGKLAKLDYFDRASLMEVLNGMVDDLADTYRAGKLTPAQAALYTRATLLLEVEQENEDGTTETTTQEQVVEGKVGLIDLLNNAIAAATKAGNFGKVAAGNGKEPMQDDQNAVLKSLLDTVTKISEGEELPKVPAIRSKTVERLSIPLNDYLTAMYEAFMNNYWNRTFEGDGGYVKPLPAKKGIVAVGKDLAAVCVRVLQRYSDARLAYKQTEAGKKAQAAVDAAQAEVTAATKSAVAALGKDPKQTNDATKQAVAAVKAAKDKLAKASKGDFKAILGVPVDCFYEWKADAKTGAMVRTIIKGKTDTLQNFLAREVLRAFMAMPQWDFIQTRLNAVLGIFGISLADIGITPEGMKSAAAKEEEKKAKEVEEQGTKALEDALAALNAAEDLSSTDDSAASSALDAALSDDATATDESAVDTESEGDGSSDEAISDDSGVSDEEAVEA